MRFTGMPYSAQQAVALMTVILVITSYYMMTYFDLRDVASKQRLAMTRDFVWPVPPAPSAQQHRPDDDSQPNIIIGSARHHDEAATSRPHHSASSASSSSPNITAAADNLLDWRLLPAGGANSPSVYRSKPSPAVPRGRLVVLRRNALDARCLDGSPPAFYMRDGHGLGANKWMIYFPGGAWCVSEAGCRSRSATKLGSTKWLHPNGVGQTLATEFHGMRSWNKSENPYFYNWNFVSIVYCDGASFAGTRGAVNGLHYSGRKILNVVLADLWANRGLKRAASLLIAGCSAGGMAVSLHCDSIARLMPRSTSVGCLMDAGFFPSGLSSWPRNDLRVSFADMARLQGALKGANFACVEDATKHGSDPTDCLFPNLNLNLVTTPTLLVNSRTDSEAYSFAFNFSEASKSRHLKSRAGSKLVEPAFVSRYSTFVNQEMGRLAATKPLVVSIYTILRDAHCALTEPTWLHWNERGVLFRKGLDEWLSRTFPT